MTPARTVERAAKTVRLATSGDIGVASEILADALMAQPMAPWLVADAAERLMMLRRYARLVLGRGIVEGQVDVLDGCDAVAVWYSRVERSLSSESWVCELRRVLGPYAPRFAIWHGCVDALLPHTPHHYLAHLAVPAGKPDAARALLAAYHRRLDEARLPSYTEVVGSRPSMSVFAGLGYQARSPVLLEPGGPAVWRMWRPGPAARRAEGLPCRVRVHRFAVPMPRRAVWASSLPSP